MIRLLGLLTAALLLSAVSSNGQSLSCTKKPSEPASNPLSNVHRTDQEIAAVLKSVAKDHSYRSNDRAGIILSGIFGPCFSAIARHDQFEIVWMRDTHEQEDRSADFKFAVTGMARAIRLFKIYGIQIEGRPSNVHFIRFKPGTHVPLYTIHWTYEKMNHALADPANAEAYLWKTQKVAIGEPPMEWTQPQRSRR